MSVEDFLASGLSLERTESSGPQQQISATAWGDAGTPGFSARISPEEVKRVAAIAAGSSYNREERFEANHLLGLYYSDLNELKRASYHIQLALTFADTHGQRAGCYMSILNCQLLMDTRMELRAEDLTLYDKYVEESLNGIQENDAEAILGVLSNPELWGDFGLMASAALAWSTHPENTDAFERESAEAAYHHYKKLFEEQESTGFTNMIYSLLPGESKGSKGALLAGNSNGRFPCRAQVRQEFLQNKRVCTLEELKQAKEKNASAPTPVSASVSYEQKRADELMAKVDAFARKYPKGERSVYTAKASVMQEYMDFAMDIAVALQGDNAPLMKALMDNYQVFEDMQDYMLLGCAATLWTIHPKNTDGRDKIAAQKKSEMWLETATSLGEVLNDMQPLEKRLRELDLPTGRIIWNELANHVNEAVMKNAGK